MQEHTDSNALVAGPTGVGLGRDGVLYVADPNGNRNVVESPPGRAQVALKTLVPDGAGDLFARAAAPRHSGVYCVNDSDSRPATNSLQLLQR